MRLWDVATRRSVCELNAHVGFISQVVFNFKGPAVLATVGRDDKTVRLWDLPSNPAVIELVGHTGGIGGLEFSPNGDQLATVSSAGYDKTVRVWNPAAGKNPRVLSGHDGRVNCEQRSARMAGSLLPLLRTRLCNLGPGQRSGTVPQRTSSCREAGRIQP